MASDQLEVYATTRERLEAALQELRAALQTLEGCGALDAWTRLVQEPESESST